MEFENLGKSNALNWYLHVLAIVQRTHFRTRSGQRVYLFTCCLLKTVGVDITINDHLQYVVLVSAEGDWSSILLGPSEEPCRMCHRPD